ncbi:MAG: hypothetical protein FWF94_04790 [Oscillospiraceae bacterium]|nr:hypothetical protein [Oscillospiraceae bacterium]
MSMPKFPDKCTILDREDAVNSILTSIAMEEAALSHIINAEGEKIQFALATCDTDIHNVIKVNESVSSLIDRVIDLQIILKNKMIVVKNFLPPESEFCCPNCHSSNKCHPR